MKKLRTHVKKVVAAAMTFFVMLFLIGMTAKPSAAIETTTVSVAEPATAIEDMAEPTTEPETTVMTESTESTTEQVREEGAEEQEILTDEIVLPAIPAPEQQSEASTEAAEFEKTETNQEEEYIAVGFTGNTSEEHERMMNSPSMTRGANGWHYFPHNNHTISETGGAQRGVTLWCAVSDGNADSIQWKFWSDPGGQDDLTTITPNYEGRNEHGDVYSYNLFAHEHGNQYGYWNAQLYVNGALIVTYHFYLSSGPYLGNETVTPAAKTGTIGQTVTLEWQGRTTGGIVDADPGSTYVKWQKLVNGVWTDRGTGSLPWHPTGVFVPDTSDLGTYQWRCIVGNNNGQNISPVTTLTVSAVKPTITKNPASASVFSGKTETFSTAASGNPAPSYQWQKLLNGTWQNISGATGQTYSVAATQAVNGTQYRCVASNGSYYGGGSAASGAATLTVNGISTQPSGQTARAGESATFRIAAYGSISKYQWQRNSGTGWANIGTSAAAYTTPSLSITDNGTQYRCLISTSAGQLTSNAASLTVKNVAPSITGQPQDCTVIVGGEGTFTVTANGTNNEYQWQKWDGSDWRDITGENASKIIIGTNIQDHGSEYRCVVSNTEGTATSSSAKLYVKYTPIITTQPQDATTDENVTVNFSVDAHGYPEPDYIWYYSTNGADFEETGIVGKLLEVTPEYTENGTIYKCLVKNEQGETWSDSAALTVEYAPRITDQSTDMEVTEAEPASMFVTVDSNPDVTYQWYKSIDGKGYEPLEATESTCEITGVVPEDNQTYYKCRVKNRLGEAWTEPIKLTVNYRPIPVEVPPVAMTARAGAALTLYADGDAYPLPDYTWYKIETESGDMTDLDAHEQEYVIKELTAEDNNTAYTCKMENMVGETWTDPVELNVEYAPIITGQPQGVTVMEGEQADFSIVAESNPETAFEWYMSTDGIEYQKMDDTEDVLKVKADGSMDGMYYMCLAKNTVGEVWSAAAQLKVVTPDAPKTGDNMDIFTWILIAVIAASVCIVVIAIRNRKNL